MGELEGMGNVFGKKNHGLEQRKVTRRELKDAAAQKNMCVCVEG